MSERRGPQSPGGSEQEALSRRAAQSRKPSVAARLRAGSAQSPRGSEPEGAQLWIISGPLSRPAIEGFFVPSRPAIEGYFTPPRS